MPTVMALHPYSRCVLAPVQMGLMGLMGLMVRSAPAQTSQTPELPAVVDRICGDCHLGDDAEQEFDLLRLFSMRGTDAQVALAVQRLRSRTMPPPDEPQPTETERRAMIAALEQLVTAKAGDRIATVRRLTRHQYELTVRDLFGINFVVGDRLPEDSPAHGFDGQGDVQGMSPLLFEKFDDVAAEVATAVLKDDSARAVVFASSEPLSATLPGFLARAFRRPVASIEVEERLQDVAAMQAAGLSQAQIEHAVLRAVLASPAFLMRAEFGQDVAGDAAAPTPAADPALARSKLTAHELAVRLSYMLSSSMPDAALRQVADDGTLLQPEVLAAHAKRLAAMEQGMRLASDFAAQWLSLRDVLTMTADFRRYGQIWNHDLRPSFLQEGLHYFAAIVAEDRSVLELLDSNYTFVNPVLAKHYGLRAVEPGFHQVTLSDKRRGGLLGMGAMLMTSSFPLRTSPVKRGKWILDKLLDSPPPPPPANIGTLPNDDQPKQDLTLRQQLEQHRQRRSCASCHAQMDALGFALENYDVVGLWRDQLHGLRIDTRATLPDGTELLGPIELKQALLARADDFVRALAKNLLVFGVGREMGLLDEGEIQKIVATTRQQGDRFSALLTAVVQSPLFTDRDPGAGR